MTSAASASLPLRWGLPGAALELGVKFASERVQFGVPIAQKQAIQAYLADAPLLWPRASAWCAGPPGWSTRASPYTQQAAMAKLFTSRMAATVTDQVVQIHGGYGFIKDYPIERYYRDARALEILEGTTQIQQIVIAGGLLAGYGIKVRP